MSFLKAVTRRAFHNKARHVGSRQSGSNNVKSEQRHHSNNGAKNVPKVMPDKAPTTTATAAEEGEKENRNRERIVAEVEKVDSRIERKKISPKANRKESKLE